MGLLISRALFAALAAVIGALAGYLVGHALRSPWWGMLVGAGVGAGVHAATDVARGNRMMDWLRGSQQGDAPRDAGVWGEVGYRVERALRLREHALRAEEQRLAQFLSAIEASPNGVLMLDESATIDWCNSVAADHFGLDPARDRRQPVTNLVRAPSFVAYLQGGVYDEPVVVPRPGGRGALAVQVRAYGNGQRLVLSQDITEREQTDAMRRGFVANVSHEIRTPLTVLAGFIETMSNVPLTEVERRRVLLLMSQQAQRMQTLVGDLLTLAQLEGSPRPPADRWQPLAGLFDQVESEARALSGGRHQLEFDAPGAVQLAGSATELRSALTNLVTNAIRYTPEGGRIRITWRRLPQGDGELAVCDNGIGIEREHIPRLTERFYRVDQSRSRDTGGTGLGLSIVKHVAQRHGAELHIESQPGKGSTFRITLPSARVRGGADAALDPAEGLHSAPTIAEV